LDKYGSIIGALTGAFLAGIIAVYSVWKTNKNNLELERKKYNTQKEVEENKYCGLLFAVFSDLYAHKKISENLDSEIQEFLAYFETEPTIPTDNPFSEFPVEFMKICRNKILDFYKYETTSFSILTHYLNCLDTLHDDLNLKRIREARINVTDKDQVIAGMNLYFDQIKDTLDKLANLRSELIDKIPEIIKSYPQSEVEDLIEQVKNQ
jgi:hypothetical protein